MMYQVQGLHRVSACDNAGDIDLTCALADHFNVDVLLCKRSEHSPGDPDHIAHLLSDESEDSHVTVYGNLERIE